jgi:ComF family protein
VEAEKLLVGFERSSPALLTRASGWQPDEMADYCSCCGLGIRSHRCSRTCECGVRRSFSKVLRLGAYAEPLSDWICMIKFERWYSMAEFLGARMAHVLLDSLHGDGADTSEPLLVPVPMPRIRMITRGIDHTRMLAEVVEKITGWPCRRCIRQKPGRTQAASTAWQRSNRTNPFTWKGKGPALKGRHVILIDDVMTTGRTARSAARILRAKGAKKVTLAVIAVTEPDEKRWN